MNLFINGRFLTQRLSGVQQFGIEICKELISTCDLTILVPAKVELSTNEFDDKIMPIGKLGGHLWEQIELPFFIKKQKNAVLLNLCNTAPINLREQGITVHDLAFAIDPKWFDWRFSMFYNFLIPRIVRASKHIFTVSETIKGEIINAYKVSNSKISVLGNKVSNKLIEADITSMENLGLKEKTFYLMVGSNNPRKNFKFVENLFLTDLKQLTLVIVGGSHEAFNSTESVNSENIIYLDFVKLGELKWLYENAMALINPSIYEGFGIPNLEAIACKALVFCSNIPVFKEIYKDSVCYFELNDNQSLKALILEQQLQPASFEIFKQKGTLILNAFQNRNRATEILNVMSK